MSDESLVTASEVAKLAGVGRAAVSNWRRRYADFPEPVGGSGASVSFRYSDVESWLREQGRLTASPAHFLWRAVEPGRGNTDVESLIARVTTYLAGLSDGADLEPHVRRQVDLLDQSARAEAVEYLVSRLFERQQRQHLTTPQGLADLIVALAGPLSGSVFDPACGPATVLRTAMHAGAHVVRGQEIGSNLAQLAAARLAMTSADTGQVAVGDSLRADAYPELRADVVVCDPPFGYRDWGHEELAIDPRWEYGVPPKMEPELAWLQHCLSHTVPGGTVVMVMPAGVAGRRSGRVIRKELLRAGALRAVLALPPGTLMSTGIPLHLWVLRNPDGLGADPLLLVDASHLSPKRRGLADWPAISEAILEPWRAFSATGSVAEIAGRQRAIDVIDLLDEDVDLTPSRYLPLPTMPLDVDELERECAAVAAGFSDLADQLPRSLKAVQRGTKSTTTISELARAGALTLRHASGRLETTDDPGADGPVVFSVRDVATGAMPSARLTGPDQDVIELRCGDVVAPTIFAGDRPRAEVIETDGWILGRNVQLLRVDPDRVDPHFLAGLLRSRSQLRNASTMSSSHRIDFRRVEVPVLNIDEQRWLGEQFRQVYAFETGLRDLAARGNSLSQHLTNGLAAGALDCHSITNLG